MVSRQSHAERTALTCGHVNERYERGCILSAVSVTQWTTCCTLTFSKSIFSEGYKFIMVKPLRRSVVMLRNLVFRRLRALLHLSHVQMVSGKTHTTGLFCICCYILLMTSKLKISIIFFCVFQQIEMHLGIPSILMWAGENTQIFPGLRP